LNFLIFSPVIHYGFLKLIVDYMSGVLFAQEFAWFIFSFLLRSIQLFLRDGNMDLIKKISL